MVRVTSDKTMVGPGLQKLNSCTRAWGRLPVASTSGPREEARLEHHLVVVKVPIDGEAMSPDPLGLAGCAGPGPPLDHTSCVTLGPHQLGGLLILLRGLCSEEQVRRSVWGGAKGPENCPAAVVMRRVGLGSLELCGHTPLRQTVM